MSSSYELRRYIDILNENNQPQQLDEGMMDLIKSGAQKLVKKLAPQQLQQITNFVSSALGKPANQITMADATMANAQKLIAANQRTNEGWGGAVAGGILGSILSLGALPTNMTSSGTALAGAALLAILCAAFGAFATSGSSPVAPNNQGDPNEIQRRKDSDDWEAAFNAERNASRPNV